MECLAVKVMSHGAVPPIPAIVLASSKGQVVSDSADSRYFFWYLHFLVWLSL